MKSFVYGGTRGIGEAISLKLIDVGFEVYAIGRSSKGNSNIKGLQTISNDLSNDPIPIELINAISEGPINLIFSQRYRGTKDIEEMSTMIQSPINIIEEIEDELKANSNIIFIGSTASNSIATSQGAMYHATKSAINSIAMYYAVKLASKSIRVHIVHPSTTIKNYNRKYFEQNPNLVKEIQSRIPLGSIPEANDIAIAVKNLITCEWPSATGISITIDGGASLIYQGL